MSIKRISVWIVLSLLTLVLLVLGGSFSLLSTQAGSRWLLQQVPGLSVENFTGAVLTDWQADQLVYQQDDLSVQLTDVQMQFRPMCLLRSAVCLDTLTAARIELNLPESAPDTEPSQGIELPELQLPVSIEIERIHVGEFVLNGETLLANTGLRARWLADGIHLSQLGVQYQEYRVQAKGKIMPSKGWPVQLQIDAQVPMPDAPTLAVQAQLTGSLQSLSLDVVTTGYVAATLKGQLQALDAQLPAQLTLKVASFTATPDVPDTLTLADLVLEVRGDLNKGYQVDGRGALPNTPEQIKLKLAALVKATGAQLSTLSLTASEDAFVAVQGAVDWQQELKADAQLQWQQFPWHSLLAQEDIAVQLQTLDGQVSYSAGDYKGKLNGDLTGPAGAFTLATAFMGDLKQVQLQELLVEAGQGRLLGTATVGFADGVDWLADIEVSKLNPAYWVAELPGELAGLIHTQGTLQGEQLQLDATVDLKGKLRGSATQLLVAVEGAQQSAQKQQWQLSQADLRLGDNRIYGTAQLDQALAGAINIELPRLVQLWPGLAGKASGDIQLSGTLEQPQAVAQLQGRGIAYDGQRVGQFELKGELLAEQRVQFALDAQRIWSGESEIGVLHIEGQGDVAAHTGQLALTGPVLNSEIKISGGLNDKGDWLGQIQQLQLSSHEQNWALEKSTAVNYLSSGELTLAAHCLKSGASSLCAGEQRLLPETKIDYHLLNFPLATLQPWMPADAEISGQLNGDFKVDLLAKGPQGKIQLDAGQGQLRVKENEQWQTFAWQTLRLSSDLTERAIASKLELKGVDSGQLEVVANIDPRFAQKKLSGHFLIEQVDLSALRPFISQVERVQGVLEGRGTLAGHLLAPNISGFVQIRDAQLSGGELPVPFEQLQVRADIQGEQLQLKGGWNSGEAGKGTIQGSVQWANQLLVDVSIKGQQLPLRVEPYANVEIAPDLRVSLKDQRLFLSGTVDVPKGLITIPQLPEQAVHVSSDARVVGDAQPADDGLQVAMDITVNVGSERLQFSGFGLNADLRGDLRVGDNMAGRGMLELLNGRYRAYGQRLELRRARLLFAGPLSQPFLDIEAVRVTGDVTAGLRLTGSALQPSSEIFSNPAMSQEQALSWLLLGRPLQGGGGDGNVMAQAALALGLMGTAPITNKLADTFGVKDFMLDSEGSGVTSSVVASGRISENVSLRYGVGVFEPASTLALRYELSKRMYLEVASGLANSLDVFYKRNF